MSADMQGMREQIIANAKLMLQVPSAHSAATIDVVVFGEGTGYIGAVMVGLNPAIEGAEGATPEGAIRKLLIAVAEMLKLYIPKLGAHQRNIHCGGLFDEDMITKEIKEAQKVLG